jgi:hypothetical protein
MTAARMVARLAGPLLSGERAGTRAAQVAADARLEETGMLRRTIGAGTHWLSPGPAVLSEATDWMDRKRACGGACSTSSTSMGYPQTPPYAWWNYHDAYGKAP